MKKILLTGGSGFIGKNIRESFLAQKYQIIAPCSRELNLIDAANSEAYFKNKTFDAVIHCAVKPGHRNAKDPTNLFYSNARMFFNLERHKDAFGKLINLGSGAVYDLAADITSACEKDIFKRMGSCEHSFCKYVVAKQIKRLDNFTDLIIFGIFGKYEDYSIRFISNAICKTLFDLPITLRQNRRFSYLDVDDLPQILEFFIENDTKERYYNVTPDNYMELADLALMIKDISGKNVPIKIRQGGWGLDYYGSNAALRAQMPQVKFTPQRQSLEKLYKYYFDNKAALDYESLTADV
jgi:GDP-L-fucose synthase